MEQQGQTIGLDTIPEKNNQGFLIHQKVIKLLLLEE